MTAPTTTQTGVCRFLEWRRHCRCLDLARRCDWYLYGDINGYRWGFRCGDSTGVDCHRARSRAIFIDRTDNDHRHSGFFQLSRDSGSFFGDALNLN